MTPHVVVREPPRPPHARRERFRILPEEPLPRSRSVMTPHVVRREAPRLAHARRERFRILPEEPSPSEIHQPEVLELESSMNHPEATLFDQFLKERTFLKNVNSSTLAWYRIAFKKKGTASGFGTQ